MNRRNQQNSTTGAQRGGLVSHISGDTSKRSIMKGGKPSMMSSTATPHSRKGRPFKSEKEQKLMRPHQTMTVFDQDGNDVTPLPLASGKGPVFRNEKEAKLFISADTASSSSTRSIQDATSVMDAFSNLESALQISGLATSRHMSRRSSQNPLGTDITEDDHSSTNSVGSVDEDDNTSFMGGSLNFLKGGKSKKKDQVEAPTAAPPEDDPDELLTIELTETETIWLLEIPSLAVGLDPAEETLVRTSNARYNQVKLAHLSGDNYVHRSMQTFNSVLKSKEMQCTPYRIANAEAQADSWDICDAVEGAETAAAETAAAAAQTETGVLQPSMSGTTGNIGLSGSSFPSISGNTNLASDSIMDASPNGMYSGSQSMMSTDDAGSDTASSAGGDEGNNERRESTATPSGNLGNNSSSGTITDLSLDKLLNVEKLKHSLCIMESTILQNNYAANFQLFRNLSEPNLLLQSSDELAASASDVDLQWRSANDAVHSALPSLQLLWNFRCEMTRGRTVNAFVWNKKQHDILAVAYGKSETSKNGLVLCWTINNVEFPTRIYSYKTAATAMAFSSTNPNLLAIGYADGQIFIHDIAENTNKPLLDTRGSDKKHTDTVWHLEWMVPEQLEEDDTNKMDSLVSISSDGRVTQWFLRKGMEFSDLMILKRVAKQENKNQRSKESKTTSFVSRLSGGLCFDFNRREKNLYLVSLEDGLIHRCSRSYNEQYLDTYQGHSGPVYRVQWAPFSSSLFLTCSADWTIRLWDQNSPDAIFKFQSGRELVNDICWSPHCSTVFASVYEDGRIEIWDLSSSTLDPVINHTVLDRKLSRVLFTPHAPCLITGDDNGAVSVYRLQNFRKGEEIHQTNEEEQMKRLNAVVSAKNAGTVSTLSLESVDNNQPTDLTS